MFGFLRRPSPPPEPSRYPDWQALVGPSYRLLEVLKQDGSLATFRAQDKAGASRVVRIYRELDPDHRQRLQREFNASRSVEHAGVVPYQDGGRAGEGWWMARPYLPGPNLSAVRLEQPEALACLAQLAAGLGACHRAGVLVRNWKLENVLRGERGWALVDLGRIDAWHDHAPGGPLPRLEAVFYLSPEEIAGQKVGPTSDLYSLGIVAYSLLSGRPVFPDEDVMRVLMAKLTESPESLSGFGLELPGAICEAVDRLLQLDPEARQRHSPGDLERIFQGRAQPLTASSPEMRSLLDDLAADGRKADAGEFTMDPARALAKLASFQFQEPHHFLFPLLAAAGSLQARRVEVRSQASGWELQYVCDSPPKEWLQALFSHPQMGLGVVGALRHGPVELVSGAWGTTLAKAEIPDVRQRGESPLTAPPWGRGPKQVRARPSSPGLSLKVKGVGSARPPADLAQLFRYSPIPILWNGQDLVARELPQAVAESEGYRVFVSLEGGEPGLYMLVDGMVFLEEENFYLPRAQAVLSGPCRMDLSYRQPIRPECFAELRALALQKLGEAAERCAMTLPVSRRYTAVYERLFVDWHRHPEKLDALAQRILSATAADPLNTVLVKACKHIWLRRIGNGQGGIPDSRGEREAGIPPSAVQAAARLLVEANPFTWKELSELLPVAYPDDPEERRRRLRSGWLTRGMGPSVAEMPDLLRDLPAELEARGMAKLARHLPESAELRRLALDVVRQRPLVELCEGLERFGEDLDELYSCPFPEDHPLYGRAALYRARRHDRREDWRILTRPKFFPLVKSDWNAARGLAQSAFSREAEGQRFLVWAWLLSRSVAPREEEMPEALATLACIPMTERAGLDADLRRRLDELLRTQAVVPGRAAQTWTAALPDGFPNTVVMLLSRSGG